MKRILLITASFMIAAATAVNVEGRTLSADEALARAMSEQQGAMGQTHTLSVGGGAPRLVKTFSENNVPTVYMFVPSSNRGFMCVAASDRAPRAILAYSDEGSVDPTALNPAVSYWINNYSRELSTLEQTGDDVIIGEIENDTRDDIEPILTSTWGQLAPYYDLTPMVDGQHTPVGCVAVALGQCMKTFNYPDHGTGTSSYDWWYDGKTQDISLNFDTISYDWGKILDVYGQTSGGTPEERAEVAKLLYSVGVAVKMQYGPSASGSGYMEGAKAMIQYFDYAESVCYFERDYFEMEEWIDIIYANLKKGQAVPYSGSSASDGGHAFVCDGYKKGGYFHFNWGWYGSYNGYYLITALNPATRDRQYTNGYNADQAIITGLVPSSQYAMPIVALRVNGDFQVGAKAYARTPNGELTFKGQYGFFARSYAKADVELGIRLTDADGNEQYITNGEKVTFKQFSPVMSYTVPMSMLPESGSYVVEPVFRDSQGVWHDIRAKVANVRSLYMTVQGNRIDFSESPFAPEVEFSDVMLESPLLIGKKFGVRATVKNNGSEFFNDVYVVLVKPDTSTDTTYFAIGPKLELNLPSGTSENMEWVGKFNAAVGQTLTAGTYGLGFVKIENGKYRLMSDITLVDFRAGSSSPTMYALSDISVDGATTTLDNPAPINGDSAQLSIEIKCAQGYFNDVVLMQILELDTDKLYAESHSTFVGIEGGDSHRVTLNADLSELPAPAMYRVLPMGVNSGRLDNNNPAYIRVGTTGIEVVNAPDAHVYPNPATTTATVATAAGMRSIDVYSVSGALRHHDAGGDIQGSTSAQLDVSGYTPGLYLVRVATDSGVYTTKLIKR